MFILYKANTLNILIQKISKILINKPLNDPLKKEIFITKNHEIKEWIKILISKNIGIHANIKYMNQTKFIYDIIKKKYFLNKNKMIWKIFKIFKKHKNQKKFFFLSENIVEIFNKYILYEINFIKKWKKKKKKIYKKIWNAIIISKNKKKIFMKIISYFKKKIKKNKKKIPKRIFIFNILDIKPLYLSIFYEISKFSNVYILYHGPNYIYKNSLINYKNINNPILKSCGKLSYKYISKFIKKKKKIKILNFYKKNKEKSILNILQNQLIKTKIKKKYKKKKDKSIKIYSCNSKYQEIELLHINILKILNKSKKISPKNILVLSTKMDSYVTYIKTIFNLSNNKNKIPFTILNNNDKKTKLLIYIINFLLNLNEKEITNKEIINFIQLKYISKKFNIKKNNIITIKRWIEKTGIKFGLDNNHLKNNSLLEIYQNTWLFGINRILLGLSMSKKKWKNIKPYSINLDNSKDLLGKVIFFLKKIKKWRKIFLKKEKLNKWKKIFKKILKEFLPKKIYLDKKTQKIIKIWKNLVKTKCYKKKIKINVFKNTFLKKIQYLKNIITNLNFIKESVTFSNIDKISGIKFKMIYILGLNNNLFPRSEKINLLDFAKFNIKEKEYNIFNQDRNLFLELILSTKKYFYISYIGYDSKNFQKINPSILIIELQNYILNITQEKKKIKNLSRKIIYDNNIITSIKYNKKKKIKNKKILKKKKNQKIKKKIRKIKFKNFIKFWENPISFFFIHSLKINLRTKKNNKKEKKKINEYILKKKIFENIIKRKKIKKIFKNEQLEGRIPYGNIGKNIWNQNIKDILIIIKEIYKKYNKRKILKTKISSNSCNLSINIKNIQKKGIFSWIIKKINIYEYIKLWIKHLIYSIYYKKQKSTLLGLNNTKLVFKKIKKKKAYKYLDLYIKGYIQGQKKPLLLTKSGIKYYNLIYQKKKKKKSIKIFLKFWNGNKFQTGEKKDLYIRKTIPKINPIIIKKLLKITKFWYRPILKYKK